VTELMNPAQVERVMLFLSIGGPRVGVIFGTMLGAHKRRALPTIIAGTLAGGLCSVAYGMWKLYCAITNTLGLGSVTNLVVQLVMFAVIGGVLGITAFKLSALFRDLGSRNNSA